MTRRLAISMLLTVWAILIASGVTAYLTTRSVLIANIDRSLVDRAPQFTDSDRYVVKNEIGQTIKSSMTNKPTGQPAPKLIRAYFGEIDGQRVRTATVEIHVPNSDRTGFESRTVTLSQPTEDLDRLLNRLIWALAIAGCIGGILAAVVARIVAGIALRPLRTTADTIGSIDEQNLGRRIETAKLPPELLPVAEMLNEMLSRLEQSFANRKQFLADASHELRTPVAALVTTMEVSLRRLRGSEDYRETLQTCLGDARLLRRLVDALMEQARGEIAALNDPPVLTNITELLHQCAELMKASAEQRGLSISLSIEEGLEIPTQPTRLRQAVLALIENAIEHGMGSKGAVEVAANLVSNGLSIRISDHGPGIPPEHLPHLFEPFYRASRTRESSGGHLGLGLYLVQSHISALGGKCYVKSTVGTGAVFEILLPVSKKAEKSVEHLVVG